MDSTDTACRSTLGVRASGTVHSDARIPAFEAADEPPVGGRVRSPVRGPSTGRYGCTTPPELHLRTPRFLEPSQRNSADVRKAVAKAGEPGSSGQTNASRRRNRHTEGPLQPNCTSTGLTATTCLLTIFGQPTVIHPCSCCGREADPIRRHYGSTAGPKWVLRAAFQTQFILIGGLFPEVGFERKRQDRDIP